tara:strand:+ start:19765 stop:20958 length:1194 start_codon:yes stop_codon:yes gene_type:complete
MPMPLTPPLIEDEGVLARYPFLPQSRDFIRMQLGKNNIDVQGLIEEPWLEDVRKRGNLRLVESVMHRDGIDSATTVDISSELGRMTEALSFLHAMLIVCASFEDRLLNRWVEGESSRADSLFGMDENNFEAIAKTYLSDIRTEGITDTKDVVYLVPMVDYLELCPKITGSYWRLINRPVSDGWVRMDAGSGENSRQRTARLLKERVRQSLTNDCKDRMAKMDDAFASIFADAVDTILGLFSEQVAAELPMSAAIREDWPPCFESAVSELAQGVNVNHTGRLFLASMSRAMAHSQEVTCSFFANAPDYNAETTTYQVNHIYERQYTPHGCQSLKTGARCPVSHGDDRLCDQEWMDHPLKYLRAKQRRRYQNESESDSNQNRNESPEGASKTNESSDSS